MFLDDFHSVHCIGIGGIGISAVAKFLRLRGKTVSGSDVKASDITRACEKLGIVVTIGASAANIPAECDAIVYTEAAGEENVERIEAARRGIRQLGHFDFLGALSKEYRTMCITGTNGKSTTTAMAGKIFDTAGFDPTVFVGSLVPGWEHGNLRLGASDILIVEGDEYKQKMVKLFPEMTVITNVEEDHLDVYRDLNHIVATFQELVDKTAGTVFVNADDVNSRRLASLRIVHFAAKDVADVRLAVPGEFNRANAAGARAVARAFDIPDATIVHSLESYTGIWRRFERVGQYNGAEVISDYAHHPTAVAATLKATKEFFPNRRIVLLFEPHQHSRTKELFDDFVDAFDGADILILSEIYGVAGRKESEGDVTSKKLLDAIIAKHPSSNVRLYAPNLEDAERQLRGLVVPNDVVLVMGAGDVDSVARKLAG